MSILSGFKKIERYIKQSSGYQKISQWTSAESVEFNDGTILEDKKKEWDSLAGSSVTGIKGNTETTYRTGNVNLTPTNIGAAPTSHASTETTYGVSSASNYGHVMASSTTPKANGTAAAGTETAKFARGDHVHPLPASLATARTIDGVSFNGSAAIVHYGTCSTAAATAAKVVACTGFTLVTGAVIRVKFTITNTAASPTLNVNNTGAKAIYYRGAAIAAGYLAINRTYEFVYNGTQYELVGDVDTDTTYTEATTSKPGLLYPTDKQKIDRIGCDFAHIYGTSLSVSISTSGNYIALGHASDKGTIFAKIESGKITASTHFDMGNFSLSGSTLTLSSNATDYKSIVLWRN